MNRRTILFGAGGALLLAGAGALGWRLSVGSMAAYEAWAAGLRAPLPDDPAIADLLRYATLAANSHNTQPWQFRVEPGMVEILPDFTRRTPVVDPDDHHLFASLGSAGENLAIAAAATGRPGALDIDADGSIRFRFTAGEARPDRLFAAIPARQSTRADYDGRSVAAADIDALARAAVVPGVRLILLTERQVIDRLRDLVVAGNTAQMGDAAFMAELKQWIRFNPRSAMESGDGLLAAASGNPVLPTILGGLAFDQFVTAAGENDRYARQIDSSAGIAVFVSEHDDRQHWIAAGRASQRFALAATGLGLKHAFLNQPVEVAGLRPELAALVGEVGRRPDIVMRFGHGPALPLSPRRPVAAVIVGTRDDGGTGAG